MFTIKIFGGLITYPYLGKTFSIFGDFFNIFKGYTIDNESAQYYPTNEEFMKILE